MKKNRILLFQFLRSGKFLKQNDISSFERAYFTSDSGVQTLWNFMISTRNKANTEYLYTDTSEQFYSDYACDLQWAKDGGFCGTAGGNQQGGNQQGGNQQGGNQQGGNQQGGTRYVSPWKPINFTVDDIKNGVKTLEKLMKGDVVSKIQEELIKHGFTNVSKTGKPDNFFGRRTEQSVKDFQKKMGIPETGTVNDLTMINLEKPKDTTPIKTVPTKNTTGIRGEKKIINVEDL